MTRLPCVVLLALVVLPQIARAGGPEDEVRATFQQFVAAQNAHDVRALAPLLLDSPRFLWVTRGSSVWGRSEALKRFEVLYGGTWHLEPDLRDFRIVLTQSKVAQLFVPIDYSIGAAGQPAQDTRFLMNQTLVKVGGKWVIASILPIPVPNPTPPPGK